MFVDATTSTHSNLTVIVVAAVVVAIIVVAAIVVVIVIIIRCRRRRRLVFITRHTTISATVSPISVQFCMMVNITPGQVLFPFGGGVPRDPQIRNLWPKFGHLTANISKTVSRSVTCPLELKNQLDGSFLKMYSMGR